MQAMFESNNASKVNSVSVIMTVAWAYIEVTYEHISRIDDISVSKNHYGDIN